MLIRPYLTQFVCYDAFQPRFPSLLAFVGFLAMQSSKSYVPLGLAAALNALVIVPPMLIKRFSVTVSSRTMRFRLGLAKAVTLSAGSIAMWLAHRYFFTSWFAAALSLIIFFISTFDDGLR